MAAPRFADAILGSRELGPQNLQRDAPAREALFGLVDLAHPAFADEALDQVFADPLHGSLRRMNGSDDLRLTS